MTKTYSPVPPIEQATRHLLASFPTADDAGRADAATAVLEATGVMPHELTDKYRAAQAKVVYRRVKQANVWEDREQLRRPLMQAFGVGPQAIERLEHKRSMRRMAALQEGPTPEQLALAKAMHALSSNEVSIQLRRGAIYHVSGAAILAQDEGYLAAWLSGKFGPPAQKDGVYLLNDLPEIIADDFQLVINYYNGLPMPALDAVRTQQIAHAARVLGLEGMAQSVEAHGKDTKFQVDSTEMQARLEVVRSKVAAFMPQLTLLVQVIARSRDSNRHPLDFRPLGNDASARAQALCLLCTDEQSHATTATNIATAAVAFLTARQVARPKGSNQRRPPLRRGSQCYLSLKPSTTRSNHSRD